MTDPKIHHMTMGYTTEGLIDAVEFTASDLPWPYFSDLKFSSPDKMLEFIAELQAWHARWVGALTATAPPVADVDTLHTPTFAQKIEPLTVGDQAIDGSPYLGQSKSSRHSRKPAPQEARSPPAMEP